jgi:hypothetical protein
MLLVLCHEQKDNGTICKSENGLNVFFVSYVGFFFVLYPRACTKKRGSAIHFSVFCKINNSQSFCNKKSQKIICTGICCSQPPIAIQDFFL